MSSSRLPERGAVGEVPHLVLLGGGHAHLSALRRWRGLAHVRTTLVVTRPRETYSGMLGAVLRGEASREAATLEVAAAGRRAGCEVVIGTAEHLDPAGRALRLADGRTLEFDLLSVAVGTASGAPSGAIPARDILPAVPSLDRAGRVVVAGGGAAGIELAIALACRGLRVALAAPALLPDAPAPARRMAQRALARRGIVWHVATVACVDAEGAILDGGGRLPGLVVWAGPGRARPLAAAAGLACAEGYVRVDAALRSLSHPHVFAAGSAADLARAKSGAIAVASGLALRRALLAVARGAAPLPWRPPAAALAIIGLGDGRGLGWRGGVCWQGRSAAWLKRWLDARWMAAFRDEVDA